MIVAGTSGAGIGCRDRFGLQDDVDAVSGPVQRREDVGNGARATP